MSNSLKDGDVGSGLHFWLIRKLWTDHNGWPGNLFLKIGENDGVAFVSEALLATKFKTKDDAEKAAFNVTIKSPELIQKLKVELV
jgi:hypothetical protein